MVDPQNDSHCHSTEKQDFIRIRVLQLGALYTVSCLLSHVILLLVCDEIICMDNSLEVTISLLIIVGRISQQTWNAESKGYD